MTRIVQTTEVLHLQNDGGDRLAVFANNRDQFPDEMMSSRHFRMFMIPRPTWKEMGEPETVTIHVEIGDTLNEERSFDYDFERLHPHVVGKDDVGASVELHLEES